MPTEEMPEGRLTLVPGESVVQQVCDMVLSTHYHMRRTQARDLAGLEDFYPREANGRLLLTTRRFVVSWVVEDDFGEALRHYSCAGIAAYSESLPYDWMTKPLLGSKPRPRTEVYRAAILLPGGLCLLVSCPYVGEERHESEYHEQYFEKTRQLSALLGEALVLPRRLGEDDGTLGVTESEKA